MLAASRQLRIRQAPDSVANGTPIKVFQYRAQSEDGVCLFRSVQEYLFFSHGESVDAPCYGEVWTDERFNLLRVSEHLELSGRWKAYESVVTYGWLRRAGEADRLIPVTILTQIRNGKKVYWCRGLFTNYRIFDTRTRIVTGYNVQSLPQ